MPARFDPFPMAFCAMVDRLVADHRIAHLEWCPLPSPASMCCLPWAAVLPVMSAPQMLQIDTSV